MVKESSSSIKKKRKTAASGESEQEADIYKVRNKFDMKPLRFSIFPIRKLLILKKKKQIPEIVKKMQLYTWKYANRYETPLIKYTN